MPDNPNRILRFWKELKRRKVLPILIAYVATCYAVIEFFDITSNRFAIPDKTFDLLYLLAAVGIPLVIILPWFIYRKKEGATQDESVTKPDPAAKADIEPKHNLPAQLTSFIGREKEMQTIKELVSKHRIVSLTGAGGCGKTRLACEVGAQLVQDYKDGVWLVDLAPITSEDFVIKEITEVLKMPEEPNRAITDTLIDLIKDKNMLIILDNCEHLIKACAENIGKLVRSVPGLFVLTTSREALNITGEKVWRIPSLSLVDPKTIIDIESVKDSEAVLLFRDRAQLSNPEFELEAANVSEVVTICNKLDGIPLALELVASRTRHMDIKMILERFADSFDLLTASDPGTSKRQETLHATIDWSYNLLSDGEKLLFARLSVFSGGFDLSAAEEVCSDKQLPREAILETLSKLVDRSLIYTIKTADHNTRYHFLETIRQYGHHVIEDMGMLKPLKRKHLQYYMALVEEAYQEQYEDQLKWLNKLDTEDDNLMAAIEWSKENSPEVFCWLAGSTAWYWMGKTKLVLARQLLEKANSIDTGKPETKARVLNGLGWVLCMFNEFDRGIELTKESLNIWRSLDNLKEQAFVLAQTGFLLGSKLSDTETRLTYCEQGLEIARQLGKPGLINHCLTSICQVLVHSKQFKKGLPYVEELIESSEKLQQPSGIMGAKHYHSDCALAEKDYKEAEKRYAHGLSLGIKYGNHWIAFADMQGVAFALAGQRRWKKSLRLNAASVEKSRTMGVSIYGMLEFWDEWIDIYIEGAKKEVGEELAKQYEEEGIAMGFDKAVEYALDFDKD